MKEDVQLAGELQSIKDRDETLRAAWKYKVLVLVSIQCGMNKIP